MSTFLRGFVLWLQFPFSLPIDAWMFWRWIPWHKAKQCGHNTAVHELIRAEDGWTITSIRVRPIDYCHKCLEAMAIRCSVCKKPIFIGNGVSLARVESLPEGAVWYNESLQTGVVCTSTECCNSHKYYSGSWQPPGRVELFPVH